MNFETLTIKPIDIDQTNWTEVSRLYNQLNDVPKATSLAEITNVLDGDHIYLVQDNNHNNIAMFALETKPKTNSVFLHIIVIDETSRNKKIGSFIIDYIKKSYPKYRINLLSSLQNTNAHRFYEREGFMYQQDIKGRFNICKFYSYATK